MDTEMKSSFKCIAKTAFVACASSLLLSGCASEQERAIQSCITNKGISGTVSLQNDGKDAFLTQDFTDDTEVVVGVDLTSGASNIEKAHYESYTTTVMMPIPSGNSVMLMPTTQIYTDRIRDSLLSDQGMTDSQRKYVRAILSCTQNPAPK